MSVAQHYNSYLENLPLFGVFLLLALPLFNTEQQDVIEFMWRAVLFHSIGMEVLAYYAHLVGRYEQVPGRLAGPLKAKWRLWVD